LDQQFGKFFQPNTRHVTTTTLRSLTFIISYHASCEIDPFRNARALSKTAKDERSSKELVDGRNGIPSNAAYH
jgi:hypothetical protein